ncbi:MAG: S-layer protein domain-containing protein [Euryarchaeota archaeon]|nr:S-layer protein domain-containing protein [Euryarchaeota archaeon]
MTLIGCTCADALASNGDDIKTLVTEEKWDIGGGYTLEAKQIDYMGEKVLLYLYKDEHELDDAVIYVGGSDLQHRVYTYTEGDVLIFSCHVSAVFRGTCSNMIQVKDVFLIDDQFSGDYEVALDDCWVGSAWDISEGYSIAAKDVALNGNKARIVLLKNGAVIDERILTEESIAPIDSDAHYRYVKDGTEIVSATLKAAFHGDILNAVELAGVYQRSEIGGSILLNNESHLFKSADPTGIPWDLADGYVLTMKDVGFNDEVLFELSKNGAVIKETILNESSAFTYTTGIGGISCVIDHVFCGCEANAVKLVDVNQYSDINGTGLLIEESYFYKTADPTIQQWELLNGYVLTMKDIEEVGYYSGGNKVWLELSRDGSVVKDDILKSGDFFVYETGIEIVNCTIDAVFRGTLGDMVRLVDVNQYTETSRQLIDRGSKTFATTNPTGDAWGLYEGYSLDAKDIDLNGDKVWLSLSKNSVVVDDAIVDSGRWSTDRWFKYYNSTGALLFGAYVDAVFCGTDSSIVQLMYVTQYSDVDGSVLIMFGEEDKKTLSAGTATTILPLITTPIDGQVLVEGDAITFGASAADGTAPYTYTWYEDGSIIGTGNSFDAAFGTGSHTITLIIADAAGTSVSDRVRVEIKSRGDVNRDGGITTVDALIVSQMAVRGEYDPFADVSGDGQVNSLDMLMILQAAAGDIDL